MGIQSPVAILADQTDQLTAGNEVSYDIDSDRVPTTIVANNLAGSEEVDVFFSIDGGTTWVTLYVDGSAVVLTATDNAKTFYGPMKVGFLKDTTAGACGIYAYTGNKV